ncbi:hypothetical protein ABEB36_012870 [Hypothenemus hampei]|uniref:RNA-directed DNA polymerase n=1 Tax=Hypothenemus hampei TaxID=57062 RepID=A0ABD1E6C7_HYPHA
MQACVIRNIHCKSGMMSESLEDRSSEDSADDRGRYIRKRKYRKESKTAADTVRIPNPMEINTPRAPTVEGDIENSLNINDLISKRIAEILSKQLMSPPTSGTAIGVRSEMVPLFDPEKGDITSANWVHKIEQLADVHKWDDATKSYIMQTRLKGVAKIWYNALLDYNKTWTDWKLAILEAFPTHEYYMDNLKKMISRKKGADETMMHYYYEKCIMIRKCEISDVNAVSCIIDGLPIPLQSTAKSGNYKTPEQLFQGLLSKLEEDSTISMGSKNRQSQNCFVCNRPGHIASRCRYNTDMAATSSDRGSNEVKRPKLNHNPYQYPQKCTFCQKLGHSREQCRFLRVNTPRMSVHIKRCTSCGKNGHLEQDCYYKKTTKPSVVSIINRQVLNDKYFIHVSVNGIVCKGYLDSGSQINVAEKKLAHLLTIHLEPPDTYISGFGNCITYPIGKGKANLNFHDFSIESDIYFVDVPFNNNIDIIIGQPVINNSKVELIIRNELVQLRPVQAIEHQCQSNTGESYRKESINIVYGVSIPPGQCKEVFVESNNTGKLLVPAQIRNNMLISTTLTENTSFKINVTNIGSSKITLKENQQLTKAYPFSDHLYHPEIQQSCEPSRDVTKIHVNNNISSLDKQSIYNLLEQYSHCFANNTLELGKTDVIEFEINLHSREPVFYKPYRISEQQREVLRAKINDLLSNNIIKESHSSYSSPAILIRKKNGDYRIAIDYRKLNKITVKDRYPLPNIEDYVARLKGYKYFCTLDMTQGYYQVPIAPNSTDKTAFVTPDGQYEFLRMPFGLCNAPATFQRLINTVLKDLRHTKVLIYLDDILIPSYTVKEGLEILKSIFRLFQEANLKFNMEKCHFFETEIEYLGYEVSENGIKPSNHKIQAVSTFPQPKTVHEARQFLGLCSYFRKFVQNHALIVQPIQKLLKKESKWEWGQDQNKAFEQIKSILVTRPLLSIFDNKLPTELHTDASCKGIASIMMQRHESGLKPTMYYSRTTTKTESVYHSFELETLAVIESIKRFRIYLIDINFKIITDCSAVRYTFNKKDLNPRIARWWLSVQEFNFDIEHRPGKKMEHVDALSRNIASNSILTLNVNDWLHCIQMQDEQIISIIKQLKDNPSRELKNTYTVENDRLYRRTADGELKFLVPKYAKFNILRKFHDDMGHLGHKKCEELIKSKFWFKGMTKFIRKYVRSCLECAFKHSQYGRKEGFLFPFNKPSEPLHTWHIDHLGPFCKSSGYSYILMVVDSFSKFLLARPARTTSSKETIQIMRDLFALFGTPQRIITDWGKAFTAKNFKDFCIEKKIKHVLNTISSPRSNGQVERYNRTLLDALNTSIDNETEWFEKLPQVVAGLNNSTNVSTGFTPYRLMFGYENTILGDLGTSNPVIDRERDRQKQSIQMKKSFDATRKSSHQYQIDDLVLWSQGIKDDKRTARKTGNKFAGPYQISKILGNDRYELRSLKSMRGYKRYRPTVSAEQLRLFTGGVVENSDSESETNSTDDLLDLLEG